MDELELLIKLRQAFKVEASERISSLCSGFIDLEKQAHWDARKKILESLYREAHSLKGAARAVELSGIEMLCQSIEEILDELKQQRLVLCPELFDVLHQSVGSIERFLMGFDPQYSPELEERFADILNRLQDVRQICTQRDHSVISEKLTDPDLQSPPCEENADVCHVNALLQSFETVRLSSKKLDQLLLKLEELIGLKLIFSRYISQLKDILIDINQWNKYSGHFTQRIRKINTKSDLAPKQNCQDDCSDDSDELNAYFHETVSHVKNFEKKLRNLVQSSENDRRILDHMVDTVLDDMKQLTLMPFSHLFEGLPRMIREIAREQGKQIRFSTRGSDIEVDRRILERIKDPLIHLIRNAVDHALETPTKRKELNKPEAGKIEIIVSQPETGRVEIQVSDDGKGIDVQRVRDKAVKMGILSQSEAATLSEDEMLALIFRPNLSTSPIITQISGRGVGLSVVQESLESLGGNISVATRKNKGTHFFLRIPVTLATFRGILVQVSGQLFIVPNIYTESVLKIPSHRICTVEQVPAIVHHQQMIPLVKLAEIFKLSGTDRESSKPTAKLPVVIIRSGDKLIGLEVDEVHREQEVLVKSLGPQLARVPNIVGATILETGRIALVLNVQDLMKSAIRLKSHPNPSRS